MLGWSILIHPIFSVERDQEAGMQIMYYLLNIIIGAARKETIHNQILMKSSWSPNLGPFVGSYCVVKPRWDRITVAVDAKTVKWGPK